VRAPEEAATEIVRQALKLNAWAILSGDTDFLVHSATALVVLDRSFDIDAGPKHFTFYRVVGDGAGSRNFNRDECGFRVPEAPATPLLLLGAFPAGALIAVKATGVRLPLPHLHRVA